MKALEIDDNIHAMLNKSSGIEGHFNTQQFNLGNGKIGYDIFTFTVNKKNRKILLTGLYKDGVKRLLQEMGIFNKKIHGSVILIKKEKNVIWQITLKEIKDAINVYLNQLPKLKVEISGITETFTQEAQKEMFYKQANIVLNDYFLDYLEYDTCEILKDEIDQSYMLFENGIMKISEHEIILKEFGELFDKVVWKNKLIRFQISNKVQGQSNFEKFIHNVCSNDTNRINAFKSGLGYLLHSYHKKSGGQMIVLYDEQITDLNNPQGGTGKGVVANAIKCIRNTVKIDGKKLKGDNRFDFQDIRLDTEVVWIDDVGKDLNIDRFNSISTDGFNIEQKFKDSIFIPAEESPKILICSNIIMDCTGTTRKRRQFIIELAPYYSSLIKNGTEEPIIHEHGGRFFSKDWDDNEWNLFYWFMMDCLQSYLKTGLVYFESKNVFENRSRQIIGDDLHNWLENKALKLDVDYPTKQLYEEYKHLFEGDNSKFTQRSFSNKIKQYYTLKDLKIKHDFKSENSQKTSVFRISN